MADEIRRMQDYTASDVNDNIAEVRTARGTFDTLDDRLDNIEGGGFTPTTEQLAAMNSTATQEKIDQIETNKNNILKISPVTLTKRHIPQSADYEIVSDLTISVPAGKKYLIHATATFNNVAPKGVIINKTNAIAVNKNTVFAEINGGETDYGGLTVSAIVPNTGSSAFDICIFVKYKSANASGSDVTVTYQDIT